MTSKEGNAGKSSTEQAKELLKQYGGAYLLTSISLSIVSFSACYAAVNAGEASQPPGLVPWRCGCAAARLPPAAG